MYVLILWLTNDDGGIAVTSQEFETLEKAAAAGEKVLEKAPLTETGTPRVRWVCVEK